MKYYQSVKSLRKGTGIGWRGESIRHGLAARGVRTTGKTEQELARIKQEFMQKQQAKKKTAEEIKKDLKIMRQYVTYQSTGKGPGKYVTPTLFDSASKSAKQISATSGGRFDKEIARLERRKEFYEKTSFIPKAWRRKKK